MLLKLKELQQAIQRPRSAPPSSIKELGPFQAHRLNYLPRLGVNPQLFIKEYKDSKIIFETDTTTVIQLDEKYILKLTTQFLNVEEIAGIMHLARKVIPVPLVFDYGHSGNCSYILMEYVKGCQLEAYIRTYGKKYSQAPSILYHIDRIVQKLASVGISHNDLYPRNIIVNEKLDIVAVVDWDVAGPLTTSHEYINRLYAKYPLEEHSHDWDHIFLKYCPDKLDLISFHVEEYRPYYKRQVRLCPAPSVGFWRPDNWPGLLL